jgi:hypothetical protein
VQEPPEVYWFHVGMVEWLRSKGFGNPSAHTLLAKINQTSQLYCRNAE